MAVLRRSCWRPGIERVRSITAGLDDDIEAARCVGTAVELPVLRSAPINYVDNRSRPCYDHLFSSLISPTGIHRLIRYKGRSSVENGI
jgi:hypothetical protein